MDLDHLRTFIAIVEAGGVGRAAARLNLTQPTASRQIHALEARLGVRLFDRVGRRVQLTSEGEDLLQRSRRLLADAESLGERARALTSGETGVLRVGATPQGIESVLANFIAQHQQRHPNVEIRLVEDGGSYLASRLQRGDVHVTMMPHDERFQSRLLFPNHLLALLPKGHRLHRHSLIDIGELLDDPLLLLGRGFASRDWFFSACDVARVRPRVFLESGSPQTLIALAASGYGIAVIPAAVLIPRGKFRAVPLISRKAAIGAWTVAAWDSRRFLAPYAKRFVEELVIHTRRHSPNRDLVRQAPKIPQPKEHRSLTAPDY